MLKVFSVYDSKAGAYTNPMVLRSAPEAIRAFGAAASHHENDFYKFAEDYTLFEIGEWDEIKGQIISYDTPRPLCKAIEVSNSHKDYYFASREKVA